MFKEFLKDHNFSDYRFSSDIFPTVSDRDFWNGFQNEACVEEAERELDYTWPVIKATDFMEFKKSGNRNIMENIHFDRRNHLILFALAELKENKGRFLLQIVNGLLTTCEETFWGLSAHWPDIKHELGNIHRTDEPYIDLFAAETAEHLSMIITLLGNPLADLCPEIIDRVEYELERRIKAPYLLHRDWEWIGYHKQPNNWNPWILSNLLTVFLLTEKNERRLQRALEKMLTEIQFYYDALPADGGCDEGPGYWGHAGASLFEFLYQLKTSTKGELDLFGDEKIGCIADYLKKVHVTADIFVNVADARAVGKSSLLVLLYGFAKETSQKALMNFSVAAYRERTVTASPLNHNNRTMRRLIYSAEFLCEMEEYEPTYPLHGSLEYLPCLELAVLRRGDLILSAKGGFNNESHNHNDVGSITFYDGATPVLIDVGINTYTRFTFQNSTRYTFIPWTQARNHNIPMVNGEDQPFGKEFCADRFEATEEKIEISFAGAYSPKAGLMHLNRTVCLEEDGMCCTDCFAFADRTPRSVTEVFMSVLPVRVEDGAAILGERYCVSADSGVIHTEFIPFEDAKLESDWQASGVTRITFSADDAECITVRVKNYEGA